MFAQVIIDEILMLRISIILKEYSQMKNDIARYRIDIARYHILDIHVLKMAESDIARYHFLKDILGLKMISRDIASISRDIAFGRFQKPPSICMNPDGGNSKVIIQIQKEVSICVIITWKNI